MGVQCKLLGHTYDATEFEERREERENGTVLICREYQVCNRCGDRKELYRNEQLLPGERETATDGAAEPAAGEPNEKSDPTGEAQGAEPVSHPAEEPAAPRQEGTEAGDRGVEILDAEGSDANTGLPDGVDRSDDTTEREFGEWPAAESDGTQSDDGVVLSVDKTDETAQTEQAQQTALRETTPEWPAETPREGDSAPAAGGDSEPSSATAAISCPGCESAWSREDTSLRDGDLCPACRDAFVERH